MKFSAWNPRPFIALLHVLLITTTLTAQPPAPEEPAKYSFNYMKVVPGMPENASLGTYGGVSVNTAKGLPNISFDIYTVSKGGVNVPISISYLASGIKYNDIPSAVGLKWSLNAGGSINRSVNGIVDEDFLLNHLSMLDVAAMENRNLHINSHAQQDSAKQIAKGNYDCSLDNYYYNFPGHSGSMYLGRDQVFRPDKEYSHLQISYGNHLDSFMIRDDAGNTYVFANYTDNSTVYNTGKYNKQALLSFSARVAWKLRRIITATGQEITFEYTYHYYDYMTLDAERWTEYILAAGFAFADCGGANNVYYVGANENAFTTTHFVNTAALLSKISTDDQEVSFTYTDDETKPLFKKQLTDIKVYSKITADTIKRFHLNHSSYALTSFTENDRLSNNPVKTWSFGYNGGAFPDTYSKSRDIFGYYNNTSNIGLIANPAAAVHHYPSPLADRHINQAAVSYGVLNRIVYPTGGITQFVYEYNHETFDNGELYAPGIRLRSSWDADGTGKVTNKKNFYYSGLEGGKSYGDMTLINGPAISLEPTMEGVWHSDPIEDIGVDNFYYKKVTTVNVGDDNAGTPKLYEVDYYTGQTELYGAVSPVLIKKDIYLNDTSHLQKTAEYVYDQVDMESFRIVTYVMRPAKPQFGSYSYEDDPAVYPYCPPFTIYQGYDSKYALFPRLFNLKTVITKEYPLTSDSITNIVQNQYYSNPVYLKQTDQTSSAGKTETVKYTYPFNYTTGFPANMAASFIYAPVITEEYLLNNVSKTKKETSYNYYNVFYAPAQQTITDMGSNTSKSFQFYNYNSKGHVLSRGRTLDVRTSYIYDYMDELPVAEVINADNASIAFTSFEADGKGNWNFTGIPITDATAITGGKTYVLSNGNLSKAGLNSSLTYMVSYWSKTGAASITGTLAGWPKTVNTTTVNGQAWTCYEHQVSGQSTITLSGNITIDEVKLHPQAALMTTYTYRPLIGISSTSNANYRTNYYDYDNIGRLEYIRDDRNNILKKVAYNYASNPGNFIVPYNDLIIQAVARNNCGPGLVGTTVLYTVPAGTYLGPQANDKALAEVNSIGQALANQKGSCIVPCDPHECRLKGTKCVNNICETGVKVYTASVFDQMTGKFTCTYHYEFSNNSWSQNYTEQNSFGCPGL